MAELGQQTLVRGHRGSGTSSRGFDKQANVVHEPGWDEERLGEGFRFGPRKGAES
ncbi:hypothetical protein [Streptomyces sp. NBC_01244]|uniref:hypothetical protein n=1 Tax=Streptomyces sp. NBC_01244 TaxID=2903797 RepID=UPI002E0E5F9A|nr:hypothetical protein OG247_04610 [Streptomyces sp. NBC_01244]